MQAQPATLPPLISVIGATGTGKSQLAVELALAFNGEVINADAMQMYKGLPIITNKITDDERKGVPHHLLGFLDTKDAWQVGRFVNEAEKTIQDIRQRGRLPIIVGGTHYYIQTLLFPPPASQNDDQMEVANDDDSEHPPPPAEVNLAEKYPILQLHFRDAPTNELYAALKSVDPVMAARWHPNDRRKIRRSLEIYYASGCKQTASELYAAQRAAKSQSSETSSSPSKHRNLIFWVHAETDALRMRLDSRVGKMINSGMWEEIEEMEKLYESLGGNSVSLNAGIWQSIGFKEFLPFLRMRKAGLANEKEMKKTKGKAIEEMKTATKRYAKMQIRWIRIKFLNALQPAEGGSGASPGSLFLVDSTDVPKYDENVVKPAVSITEAFLAEKQLPDPLAMSPLAKSCLTPKRDYDISQRPDLWGRRTCEACNVICTSVPEWEAHQKSAKHKKRIGSRTKKFKELKELKNRRTKEQESFDALKQVEKAKLESAAALQQVENAKLELVALLEQVQKAKQEAALLQGESAKQESAVAFQQGESAE
ncbi:tRNA isopentenyltransferase [Wilcoxina mikolae CBS 423.85]|nr:tRNA isopentenyltransferase [Wilcoxina mikolae CBS 423.85]